MAAIFCLVSLYLHRDETPYFVTAIAFLKEAVRGDSEISDLVRILRLLVQYHTVKRHLDQNWVFHIRGLGALQRRIPVHSETMSLCVPIVYESIMKFSAHDDGFPNDGLSIDFLLHLENPQLIRDFGCSLELLHLLGTINIEVCRTMEDPLRRKHTAQSLFAKCDSIMQTSLESDRRDPVESTAESYVKMARVIICWRFCFPSPELDALGDDLAHCVRRIPTEGSWFTAQYPLAPAFWASIFSPRIGDQCLHILRSVWTDRPTNITHAIRVAEGVIARPSGTVIDMDLFKKIMTSMQMGALSLG
ncbi:hypothetical protein F5Y17DRAFT_196122 [Xylariaceae sp. FL0594]|nr:hypothetical protein F5Y17DRAFT_196122 [Xylariaceae sp. FL0594]